jgi:catechol-2,3-dioxygenase
MIPKYQPADYSLVQGLAHLLIQVSDLPAAENFYLTILGLQEKSRGVFGVNRPLITTKQGLGITLATGSDHLPPETRNLEHIAFWVSNIAELNNRLVVAGVTVNGLKQNEYGLSLWVLDPDGNRVEFIEQNG